MLRVWCQQEKVTLGRIEPTRQGVLTRQAILRAYQRPMSREHALSPDDFKDGEQTLCPRCKGALLLQAEADPKVEAFLVPGVVSFQ